MSEATHKPTRPAATRRALLTGAASALVATGLPIPTANASPADTRLLATIARVRPRLSALSAAKERSHAAYALAEADPDMPAGGPGALISDMQAQGSLLSARLIERLWKARVDTVQNRYGHHEAYDEWNRLDHDFRPILARVLAMRPRTAEGAYEKWRLVFEGYAETDQWGPEDFDEFMVPVLLADLERLAGDRS